MSIKSDTFVTEWVIRTVQEQYAEDIALVVSHTTLRIDETQPCISYFVPITKKGEHVAQTFLLEGIGYDIWGIPWERLERFSNLEEYNLTCLADATILYARSEADREHFEQLQQKLRTQLADPQAMRIQALKAYEEAKQFYLELLFATGSDAKMGVGYILDQLARAIAFSYHGYFKHSQTNQLAELQEIASRSQKPLPEDFCKRYREILLEKEEAVQKKGCYELLCLVQHFLSDQALSSRQAAPPEQNYQDLADWYGELSYTWLRIRHYTQAKDSMRTYMWGSYLQGELNQICRDFGLAKIELMDTYDAQDLSLLARRAEETEKLIRKVITNGGGQIREYATEEEFFHEI